MEPLPPRARSGTLPPAHEDGDEPRLGLSVPLDRPFSEIKQFLLGELERVYVERCLSEAAQNLSQASRISGLSRKHLRTLIAKHGISRGIVDPAND